MATGSRLATTLVIIIMPSSKRDGLDWETGDSKQTTTGVDGQVQSAHLAGDTLILETDAQALAFVYQIEGEVNI